MLAAVERIEPDRDQASRRAVAARALSRLSPGMTIGLGSGRAVWTVIDAIAERWPGRAPLRAAVASTDTETAVRRAGIELVEPDAGLSLAIDGADEVDSALGLLKGGGGALLREKLLVRAAERFLVVAQASKRVERLGDTRALPVEVVRFAWQTTQRRLLELVPSAEPRLDSGGRPVVTEEGNVLLDCTLPAEGDIAELAATIRAEVGVVEHGLFLGMADVVLLGHPDGRVEELLALSGARRKYRR